MRWFFKIVAGLLFGGVIGALSVFAGAPAAIPITLGALVFFAILIGISISEEMLGRYRVYVICAMGAGLALGALIIANPH